METDASSRHQQIITSLARSSSYAMTSLRQRPVSGVESARSAPERYERTPRPPPKRPMRQIHISITLLILASFILYASRQKSRSSAQSFELDGRQLPGWYGICSKEGKKLYTVPPEGGSGAVECIVVGDKQVVDTGSLGASYRPLGSEPTVLLISSYTKAMGRERACWSV